MGYVRANLMACVLGLAAAIFLVVAVVQSVQINGFLWWDGLNDKIEKCAKDRAELKRIGEEKSSQAQRTETGIKQAERGGQEADRKARVIEAAPTAPDCKTPPEIVGADL
jgi:hypothetical protein